MVHHAAVIYLFKWQCFTTTFASLSLYFCLITKSQTFLSSLVHGIGPKVNFKKQKGMRDKLTAVAGVSDHKIRCKYIWI